ncbi:hypothetical protein LAUMK42_03054 [Mycobacterium persicum]|uniref:Alanine and proline rich membrane protein n=1 Tax=Mycobacterium persicum TaxID=1487726 RepID=A0AB38UUY0_9MYCO|nr:hypothetical protein LAUMK42_03054 [Mycobacterium persicum]
MSADLLPGKRSVLSAGPNSPTEVTSNHLASEQWRPPYPAYPTPRSRTFPLVLLAAAILAVVLSAAALTVALTRPITGGTTVGSATSVPPTYTAAEVAAAHHNLYEVYKLTARQVQIETNGNNPALASAAGVNGAVMLIQAVDDAPALSPGDRAAALRLAAAYTSTNAMGSYLGRDDPALRTAIGEVIAKDARMKAVCGAAG